MSQKENLHEPIDINGYKFEPRGMSYEEVLKAKRAGFDIYEALEAVAEGNLKGIGAGQEVVLGIVFPKKDQQDDLRNAPWYRVKEIYERIFFLTIQVPDDLKN